MGAPVVVLCVCHVQLKHCCVKDPSDLCTVNISGQNLMEAVSADFELFCNVVVVNASDNLLPLGLLAFERQSRITITFTLVCTFSH